MCLNRWVVGLVVGEKEICGGGGGDGGGRDGGWVHIHIRRGRREEE